MKEYFVIKVASGSDHLVCLTNEGLIYTLGKWQYVVQIQRLSSSFVTFQLTTIVAPYNIVADFTTRRYCSTDLGQRYRCAAISWFWNRSVTRVQSLGPYNLTLSRPAMTSHHESRRRTRGGKKRVTWLVSWPTQTTNRMRRSQWMDREIPRHCDTKNYHNSSPKWLT